MRQNERERTGESVGALSLVGTSGMVAAVVRDWIGGDDWRLCDSERGRRVNSCQRRATITPRGDSLAADHVPQAQEHAASLIAFLLENLDPLRVS